jgi:hypothetical protein
MNMKLKLTVVTSVVTLILANPLWATSPRSKLSYKTHEFGKNTPSSSEGYSKHLKTGPASKRH